MKTVTQWFPPGTPPVHEGVYETKVVASDGRILIKGYSLWTDQWGITKKTPSAASWSTFLGVGSKHWRGLAEKP